MKHRNGAGLAKVAKKPDRNMHQTYKKIVIFKSAKNAAGSGLIEKNPKNGAGLGLIGKFSKILKTRQVRD